MPRNFLVVIIVAILLFALGLLLFYTKGIYPPKESPISSQPTQPAKANTTPDPRLGLVKIVEGKVLAVLEHSLTIQTNAGEKTLGLDQVVEVGFVSKAKATVGDIKVGQTLRITATENNAKLILIVE